jgi:hypothetical protein
MTVHEFHPRGHPQQVDYDQVGEMLDDYKKKWKSGEMGSCMIAYESRDGNLVHTDWVMLPGRPLTEALGWCHLLIKDILKAME